MCSFYIFNESFPLFSGQKVGEGKGKGKESKPKPAWRATNVPCSVSSSRSESEHDVLLYIYSSYVTESGRVWYLFGVSLLEVHLKHTL